MATICRCQNWQRIVPTLNKLARCKKYFSKRYFQDPALSVCPCVCLSMCLSVHVSVCPCVCLSKCLSVHVSVCPCVCLSMCLSVHVSVCPHVCLSTCLSVRVSVCPSVHWSIRPSVCEFVCLSVHQSVFLFNGLLYSLPYSLSDRPSAHLTAVKIILRLS